MDLKSLDQPKSITALLWPAANTHFARLDHFLRRPHAVEVGEISTGLRLNSCLHHKQEGPGSGTARGKCFAPPKWMRNTSYYEYRSNCPEFDKEGGQALPKLRNPKASPPGKEIKRHSFPRDPLVKL
jgi:hypothetical protein